MVRIRFGTFSFDKVKKSLKANFVDKLSHFGGTAGLFNGFSFISVFEFLPFTISLLIIISKFQFTWKLNVVEAENINSKETEKKNEERMRKFKDITQRFQALQTEIYLYQNKMSEKHKKFETVRQALKKKLNVHDMEKKMDEMMKAKIQSV